MNVKQTKIEDVFIIESEAHGDHRGLFTRLYCEEELRPVLGNRTIRQINFSHTNRVGAVRGLHFQKGPFAETKLVRCLKGRVFDVAVDLRRGSPTFLQWQGVDLSEDNRRMMVVPEGCAHGFQVLEEGSGILYLHTAFYSPEAEDGLLWSDPALGIEWPLPVTGQSARDQSFSPIDGNFEGLDL